MANPYIPNRQPAAWLPKPREAQLSRYRPPPPASPYTQLPQGSTLANMGRGVGMSDADTLRVINDTRAPLTDLTPSLTAQNDWDEYIKLAYGGNAPGRLSAYDKAVRSGGPGLSDWAINEAMLNDAGFRQAAEPGLRQHVQHTQGLAHLAPYHDPTPGGSFPRANTPLTLNSTGVRSADTRIGDMAALGVPSNAVRQATDMDLGLTAAAIRDGDVVGNRGGFGPFGYALAALTGAGAFGLLPGLSQLAPIAGIANAGQTKDLAGTISALPYLANAGTPTDTLASTSRSPSNTSVSPYYNPQIPQGAIPPPALPPAPRDPKDARFPEQDEDQSDRPVQDSPPGRIPPIVFPPQSGDQSAAPFGDTVPEEQERLPVVGLSSPGFSIAGSGGSSGGSSFDPNVPKVAADDPAAGFMPAVGGGGKSPAFVPPQPPLPPSLWRYFGFRENPYHYRRAV